MGRQMRRRETISGRRRITARSSSVPRRRRSRPEAASLWWRCARKRRAPNRNNAIGKTWWHSNAAVASPGGTEFLRFPLGRTTTGSAEEKHGEDVFAQKSCDVYAHKSIRFCKRIGEVYTYNKKLKNKDIFTERQRKRKRKKVSRKKIS